MSRKCCVVHGNCQGAVLVDALLKHPDFSREFSVHYVVNYVYQPLPAEELANCDLFLYQYLDKSKIWGKIDLSSEYLLSLIPSHGISFCIPNMVFKGYWPFWTSCAGAPFGDFFLDDLYEKGLTASQIFYTAMNSDLNKMFDFEKMFCEGIATERKREAFSDVSYVDLILDLWQDKQIFYTGNHPGPLLLRYCVNAVLDYLGMSPVPEEIPHEELHPEFKMPVHPQVAAFHDLKFATKDTLYPSYDTQLTYDDYLSLYILHKFSQPAVSMEDILIDYARQKEDSNSS